MGARTVALQAREQEDMHAIDVLSLRARRGPLRITGIVCRGLGGAGTGKGERHRDQPIAQRGDRGPRRIGDQSREAKLGPARR